MGDKDADADGSSLTRHRGESSEADGSWRSLETDLTTVWRG
jgi:hypothetical protein